MADGQEKDLEERQARRAERLEDALAFHRADSVAEEFRVSLSIERRKLADLADDPALLRFLATNPAGVFFDRKVFAELLDEGEQWAMAGNFQDAFSRLEGVGIMVASVLDDLALWNGQMVRSAVEQRKQAGSVSKRRAWAETVAAKIRIIHPDMTKDECWNRLPDREQSCLEFESDDADLRVWRDGDTLMCVERGNDGEISHYMKQSTFEKRYMKAGQ